MIRCPNCQAENRPVARSCARCGKDLGEVEYPECATQRIRPRVLVRQAARVIDLEANRQTDPDIALMEEPPATPTMPSYRLKVQRGLRVGAEYPLYDGANMIGRSDDRPVDIDLRDQEPRDTVWASRHHALLTLSEGVLTVEDLSSTNGTYVNRHRLPPGTTRPLKADDVLQIGTIQLKVTR